MNTTTKMERTIKFRDGNKSSFEVTIKLCNQKNKYVDAETLEEYNPEYDLKISGNGNFASGQLYDMIEPRTEGQERLLKLWKTYHNNGVSAGTNRQNAYLESEQYDKDYNKFVEIFSRYDDGFLKSALEHLYAIFRQVYSVGVLDSISMMQIVQKYMNDNPFRYILGNKGSKSFYFAKHMKDDLYVKYFFLAMHGLLIDRSYKYGSGWLHMPLPDDIEAQIKDICSQIEREEKELTESLNPVFDMGAKDFKATPEIIERVVELRGCDEEEAKCFLALGMHLKCTFGDLNDTFELKDEDERRYSANGIEYHIGTDDELCQVARDIMHEKDGDWEDHWREAVMAKTTTQNLDDWLEYALEADGWASILNHYDGTSESYFVNNEWIEICRI